MQHACPHGSRIAFIAQARNPRQRGSWSALHLPDSELTVSEGRSPILSPPDSEELAQGWPICKRPPHFLGAEG
jgi:hypothetical protein